MYRYICIYITKTIYLPQIVVFIYDQYHIQIITGNGKHKNEENTNKSVNYFRERFNNILKQNTRIQYPTCISALQVI